MKTLEGGSILSYPERGPWGDARWRGNCSGYIYRDLFQQFKPHFFIDPMMGSGTSIGVARELGIDAMGLDLHQGFNILRQSILQAAGKPADLVFSHPPYHDIIVYSGSVWGTSPHPDDLSRCPSEEDFVEKLVIALLNQRDATASGGIYGTLIGDVRRNGRYSSYQAELIARLPARELGAVWIKAQHNMQSLDTRYKRLRYPLVSHEYILLWEKPQSTSLLVVLEEVLLKSRQRIQSTWKAIVRAALIALGNRAKLTDLYAAIAARAPERLQTNPHWREKIRQTLQKHKDFTPEGHGLWCLST